MFARDDFYCYQRTESKNPIEFSILSLMCASDWVNKNTFLFLEPSSAFCLAISQQRMITRNVAVAIYFLHHLAQIFIFSQPISSSNQMKNVTNLPRTKSQSTICTLNTDCHPHSQCKEGSCVCESGWLNWRNNQPCSYQQSSKPLAFLASFFLGFTGLDWFILSRKDILYILCGILKFLVVAGCCIWSPLAASTRNEDAKTVASFLSVILMLIAFFWWLIDWIRILFNNFSDGNGAPLV